MCNTGPCAGLGSTRCLLACYKSLANWQDWKKNLKSLTSTVRWLPKAQGAGAELILNVLATQNSGFRDPAGHSEDWFL